MRVYGISRLSGLAFVAGLAVAVVGADARAWSCGNWGILEESYGFAGSSGSYGSWGSGASYGSYGRMGRFARKRARRASRQPSHGSYCSSASYGSYGSSGSYGAPVYREPVSSKPVAVAETTGKASIKVALPADAKVYVNDAPTTSTGAERSYDSRGLRQGITYSYKIHVEYEQDGETVSEDKLVRISAGETVSLTFGQAEADAVVEAQVDEPVKTEVKVQVPEDASVFLSGSPSKGTKGVPH